MLHVLIENNLVPTRLLHFFPECIALPPVAIVHPHNISEIVDPSANSANKLIRDYGRAENMFVTFRLLQNILHILDEVEDEVFTLPLVMVLGEADGFSDTAIVGPFGAGNVGTPACIRVRSIPFAICVAGGGKST